MDDAVEPGHRFLRRSKNRETHARSARTGVHRAPAAVHVRSPPHLSRRVSRPRRRPRPRAPPAAHRHCSADVLRRSAKCRSTDAADVASHTGDRGSPRMYVPDAEQTMEGRLTTSPTEATMLQIFSQPTAGARRRWCPRPGRLADLPRRRVMELAGSPVVVDVTSPGDARAVIARGVLQALRTTRAETSSRSASGYRRRVGSPSCATSSAVRSASPVTRRRGSCRVWCSSRTETVH